MRLLWFFTHIWCSKCSGKLLQLNPAGKQTQCSHLLPSPSEGWGEEKKVKVKLCGLRRVYLNNKKRDKQQQSKWCTTHAYCCLLLLPRQAALHCLKKTPLLQLATPYMLWSWHQYCIKYPWFSPAILAVVINSVLAKRMTWAYLFMYVDGSLKTYHSSAPYRSPLYSPLFSLFVPCSPSQSLSSAVWPIQSSEWYVWFSVQGWVVLIPVFTPSCPVFQIFVFSYGIYLPYSHVHTWW